ncbi:MAG: hypothetical protein FD123_1710 [Bacteroidetes bacterium]|nr:MAG: hypothetical protein FD123_1710 [Bacteroidota bacterium]
MYTLIADSGSTKTDWRLAGPGGQLHQAQTEGYNPYYISEDDMAAGLRKHLQPQLMSLGVNTVQQVFFYGAGCANEEKCKTVSAAIRSVFRPDLVEVHSDMLGAARALCGRRAGIAAILGTGSNSCFYDGNQIVSARPSLGYVLGDEGSGAHLGKQLVRAFLYGDLPREAVFGTLRAG